VGYDCQTQVWIVVSVGEQAHKGIYPVLL